MHIYNKSRPISSASSAEGSINLRVSGFSRQNIVSVAQVVQAIDVLPGFHLEGLRQIMYAPELLFFDPFEVYVPGRWGVRKGEFKQRERTIYIFDFSSRGQLNDILYHEIGHFVFFLVIGSMVKKQWVTQIFPRSECVTEYASRNASEDFAESYAAYIQDPEGLKRIPGKYEFIRDMVFSGQPGTLKERG